MSATKELRLTQHIYCLHTKTWRRGLKHNYIVELLSFTYEAIRKLQLMLVQNDEGVLQGASQRFEFSVFTLRMGSSVILGASGDWHFFFFQSVRADRKKLEIMISD